jgi:hypothetical protein
VSPLTATRTVYTVAQFLEWQRTGVLKLQPVFQRRAVWDRKARSLLIDTVVRGLPMPIVFLRQLQDLRTFRAQMEVVDGQQRLRTLLTYVDSSSLPDFNPQEDAFLVLRIHNREIAGLEFRELPDDVKADILSYEISTQVFAPSTGDDVVLRVFSRLNSTGVALTRQELRNAKYFGAFKSLSYDLALRHLSFWRDWRIFSNEEIAQMDEVEAVSDYLLTMMRGVDGKSQSKIDRAYAEFDESLEGADVLAANFDRVMAGIDEVFGSFIGGSRFRRQSLFYSLFAACAQHMVGLGTQYGEPRPTTPLPRSARERLATLNRAIVERTLPEEVQDAMDRGTADLRRRTIRHEFFLEVLGLGRAR